MGTHATAADRLQQPTRTLQPPAAPQRSRTRAGAVPPCAAPDRPPCGAASRHRGACRTRGPREPVGSLQLCRAAGVTTVAQREHPCHQHLAAIIGRHVLLSRMQRTAIEARLEKTKTPKRLLDCDRRKNAHALTARHGLGLALPTLKRHTLSGSRRREAAGRIHTGTRRRPHGGGHTSAGSTRGD